MNWIIGAAGLAVLGVIGYLLDREIYFYEGAHLGPRVQSWLYDRWSKKYDQGKRASQLQDDEMLARPLLKALSDVPEPFVLDFATGTGRLSYALLKRSEFTGRIIALDLSHGMLEQAAAKLSRQENAGVLPSERSRVELLRQQSLPLPFPDAAFDAVCALEVLEHFSDMDEPLHELIRVLRPGGLLLTSRGTEESGRKARVKSAQEFTAALERHGLERIQITKWWKLYDRVIAVRGGSSPPVTIKDLLQILECTSCQSSHWLKTSRALKCQTCKKELSITKEGIVLN